MTDKHNLYYQSETLIPNPVLIKFSEENEKHEHYKHQTNYLETLMHMLKSHIGPGIFAMGDAFKNSGMILGLTLLPILTLICVHTEHILINTARHVKETFNLKDNPDFATTVELCFGMGPKKLHDLAPYMKTTVNLFQCLTQLGCCSVYYVFISTNMQQVTSYSWCLHVHMAVILVPILLSCLIMNFKYLAPLSTIANGLTLSAVGITLYYCCQRPFADVDMVGNVQQLPLFFGTTLYAFEGIALILPLQNKMKKPQQFGVLFGILNVGMLIIMVLFSLLGAFSYLKYGNTIEGSITLNLPKDAVLAQSVKGIISLGILLTFALQFYVPMEIMYTLAQKRFEILEKVMGEIIFRTLFVLLTFTLAEIVPYLSLFISLVGAFCTTIIGLLIPPTLELILLQNTSKFRCLIITKNCIIIIVGILGCVTGSYVSIKFIVAAIRTEYY
ncbi:hypothetical protein FQA39_LY11493 [Lamprigera yunnana]|nr:hypothetical protein FQA39_LY11493 [Lamprigera yunnana]